MIIRKIRSDAYLCRSSHFGVNDDDDNDRRTKRLLYPLLRMRARGNNTGDIGVGVRLYVFSTAEVTNSNFSGNVARVAGGAMATYERSMIKLHRCNFISNTANVGGGLIAFQGTSMQK